MAGLRITMQVYQAQEANTLTGRITSLVIGEIIPST
jgi:hypothetical protein